MKHPANHIFAHSLESLQEWCVARGMPKFKAAQIMEWVYAKQVVDPAKMTTLSKLERETLAREMVFFSGEIVAHQSASDGTQKLLIEWNDYRDAAGAGGAGAASAPLPADTPTGPRASTPPPAHVAGGAGSAGAGTLSLPVLPTGPLLPTGVVIGPAGDVKRQTECVMIPSLDDDQTRKTACISSQVGCPVGCRFCASGIGGLDGNLSAGRIVEQVYRLDLLLKQQGLEESAARPAPPPPPMSVPGNGPVRRPSSPRVTNVVFMGMGEPLSNFASVTQAIRVLNAPWGLNISARKITISTVGLPKAIEKLAETFELPVTLALSLHAPNDELRRQLIPWAEYTTVKELLAACQKWFAKTGREITLEYTLLRGVNDSPEHAAQLAQVARTLRANVNLIRYNEVDGMPFNRPRTEDVRAFQEILRARFVNTHIRASRGRDIKAACGQLRHEHAGEGSQASGARR